MNCPRGAPAYRRRSHRRGSIGATRSRASLVLGLFQSLHKVVPDGASPMALYFVNQVKRMVGGAAGCGIGLGAAEPRGIPKRPFIAIRPWGQSKTRQTLWAVVGDGNTGDL